MIIWSTQQIACQNWVPRQSISETNLHFTATKKSHLNNHKPLRCQIIRIMNHWSHKSLKTAILRITWHCVKQRNNLYVNIIDSIKTPYFYIHMARNKENEKQNRFFQQEKNCEMWRYWPWKCSDILQLLSQKSARKWVNMCVPALYQFTLQCTSKWTMALNLHLWTIIKKFEKIKSPFFWMSF